jgi:hypothetical protein
MEKEKREKRQRKGKLREERGIVRGEEERDTEKEIRNWKERIGSEMECDKGVKREKKRKKEFSMC